MRCDGTSASCHFAYSMHWPAAPLCLCTSVTCSDSPGVTGPMCDGHLEGRHCLGAWAAALGAVRELSSLIPEVNARCSAVSQQLSPGRRAESAPSSTCRTAVVTDVHAWRKLTGTCLIPKAQAEAVAPPAPTERVLSRWDVLVPGRAGLIATCPKPAPHAARGVRTGRPHNKNSKQPNPITIWSCRC